MANWGKRLFGLAAITGAAAGLVYYAKKNDLFKLDDEDEFADDFFEDEDFDLDEDLKPVTDREYVPLTPAAKDDVEPEEDSVQEEPTEEAEEEVTEEEELDSDK